MVICFGLPGFAAVCLLVPSRDNPNWDFPKIETFDTYYVSIFLATPWFFARNLLVLFKTIDKKDHKANIHRSPGSFGHY